MLLRITLWAMLIGSIIMGYLGYQTGSAMTTFIGMGAIVFLGFVLFFLAKMTLSAGLVFVKVVVIIVLIGGLILLGVRGCGILMTKGQTALQTVSTSLKEKTEQDDNLPIEVSQSPSLFTKVKNFFIGKNNTHPLPVPESRKKKSITADNHKKTVQGTVTRVFNATTFSMGQMRLKLYGIDAPDVNQPCVNKRNEHYACGRMAKKKLEKLLLNKNVMCQLIQPIGANYYAATCKIQGYDIGATMVSVGWAVADRKVSAVYIPYEQQAHQANQGLWSGKFVAPWDFRANASRTATPNSSIGFLKGLLK